MPFRYAHVSVNIIGIAPRNSIERTNKGLTNGVTQDALIRPCARAS